MIMLPHHLYNQYQEWCTKSRVAAGDLIDYVKWLRYFLDFCEKYHVSGEEAQRC